MSAFLPFFDNISSKQRNSSERENYYSHVNASLAQGSKLHSIILITNRPLLNHVGGESPRVKYLHKFPIEPQPLNI